MLTGKCLRRYLVIVPDELLAPGLVPILLDEDLRVDFDDRILPECLAPPLRVVREDEDCIRLEEEPVVTPVPPLRLDPVPPFIEPEPVPPFVVPVLEPLCIEPEPEFEPLCIEPEPVLEPFCIEPEPVLEPLCIEPEPVPEPLCIEPEPEPVPEPFCIEPEPDPLCIEPEPVPLCIEPEPVRWPVLVPDVPVPDWSCT